MVKRAKKRNDSSNEGRLGCKGRAAGAENNATHAMCIALMCEHDVTQGNDIFRSSANIHIFTTILQAHFLSATFPTP